MTPLRGERKNALEISQIFLQSKSSNTSHLSLSSNSGSNTKKSQENYEHTKNSMNKNFQPTKNHHRSITTTPWFSFPFTNQQQTFTPFQPQQFLQQNVQPLFITRSKHNKTLSLLPFSNRSKIQTNKEEESNRIWTESDFKRGKERSVFSFLFL